MENKKNIRIIRSLRDLRGASIIIALSMIAAIMFFTIGMASTMLLAIQNTADSKKALQSEYAAQSGVELANFDLKDMEVGGGENDPVTVECLDGTPDCETKNTSYVTYTVKGTDDDGNTLYNSTTRSIPIKGTGNAGDCPDSSVINEDCNWNRLYYGDSIEVPLYVGTTTATLNDFGFKVRTPDGGVGGVGQNDVVLSWQLTGDSCENSSCVCVPNNDTERILGYDIPASLNESGVEPVLTIGSNCSDSVNTETSFTFKEFISSASKPKLKVSYVTALEGEAGDIPYLEYQFLYEGGPLAAVYKVNITGISNGFKFYLNGVQGLGSGLFGFAVQN